MVPLFHREAYLRVFSSLIVEQWTGSLILQGYLRNHCSFPIYLNFFCKFWEGLWLRTPGHVAAFTSGRVLRCCGPSSHCQEVRQGAKLRSGQCFVRWPQDCCSAFYQWCHYDVGFIWLWFPLHTGGICILTGSSHSKSPGIGWKTFFELEVSCCPSEGL